MLKRLLTLSVLIIFTFAVHAQTTYYVSSSGGNDNNSGTSPGSAWETISKINKLTLNPGDMVLLKSGDIWREQLNILSSGSSFSPIKISSYDGGNKPVIKGSERISGFSLYSGNIWRYKTGRAQQVYFDGVRGKKVSTLFGVNSTNTWFWNSSYLYVYSSNDPGSSIEITARKRGVYIKSDYITIDGLQIEQVEGSGVEISDKSIGAVVNNCTFYQWSDAIDGLTGAVTANGDYAEVKNCIMGKDNGNTIGDQGWAGLVGIVSKGRSNSLNNNKIYHSSLENESRAGIYGLGITVPKVSGIIKIYKNYIYHVGSHGISITAKTVVGDEIRIYENIVEYTGGAGISAYRTRGNDGIGGKGYVYQNNVSYSNRLGGDVGSAGNQSSGIHFNDGVRADTDRKKPYMKWYCYKNIVHDNMSLKVPNSPDACGISMDFNADGVEVFENLIYNNYSKGIEMWNANKCKIYYNLIYGNDAGINVTCMRGGIESANNNQIYNNTCYKNYNGMDKGPNLHTEIYFGLRGKDNVIKNNILYAADEGYAYVYNVENTSGHELDNNLVFSDNGYIVRDGLYGKLNFAKWREKRSTWDVHSVNADPAFTNISNGDFSLKANSPAINKGSLLGLLTDFTGKVLNGVPDMGAIEYNVPDQVPDESTPGTAVLGFNAMLGTLSGDAHLGTMHGSLNIRPVYFDGTSGGVSFTANVPSSGKTWYAWARVYYMGVAGKQSFKFNINSKSYVLGDDNFFNKWHWVGFKDEKLNIGKLEKGTYTFSISGREPGQTLWVDQVILTDNPNFQPNNESVETTSATSVTLFNAYKGNLSGDTHYGFMAGAKNLSVIYFSGNKGELTFTFTVPQPGKKWYAWARMYYSGLGGKNSFYFNFNNSSYVLGGDDSKYNEWHWDGKNSRGIPLGELHAGNYNFSVSARQPGFSLWIDQIVITDDPSYDPNILGKETAENIPETAEDKNIPEQFELSQNFPNPFNPTTTIKYSVPQNAHVVLKIFDILGAEVQTLVDEVKTPGFYEANFNASNLASGIYIYQLRTNNFVQAKKMNLIK